MQLTIDGWICSCGDPMTHPTLRGDGTPYDQQPGARRRIMCVNEACPEFEVRYWEPVFTAEVAAD